MASVASPDRFDIPDVSLWPTGHWMTLDRRKVWIFRRHGVTFVVARHREDEHFTVTKLKGGRELGVRHLRNLPPGVRAAMRKATRA